MVFAVWAPGPASTRALERLDRALAGAVADAHEHAADVARAAAGATATRPAILARYFEHLRYRFGARERAGLRTLLRAGRTARAPSTRSPTLRFAPTAAAYVA